MEKQTLTWRTLGRPLRTVQGSPEAVAELFTVLSVSAGVTDLSIASETDAQGAGEGPCESL